MIKPIACTLALTAALSLGACGNAPTRSGQTTDPVTLSSELGGIEGDLIQTLSDETADSAVRVAQPIGAEYGTDEDDTYEGEILDAVRAGEIDVTAIRADILASAGAASLSALQVPWLVTSEAQAAKISADPIAADLMADLTDIGVVGLALVPAGLRHPFGYGRPLLGPADFRRTGYNVRHGDGMGAIVAGLGAVADYSRGDVRRERIAAGTLGVLDASLLQPGSVDLPGVVTSNVTFYTRFDAIIVNLNVWEGLTPAQQEALRASALKAAQDAVAERQTEAEALDSWCEGGSTLSVIASEEDIAGLHDTLAPVEEAALADSQTQDLATVLRKLGQGAQPPEGEACGTLEIGTNADYLVGRKGDQNVFDGVWRLKVDAEKMIASGVSAADAHANAGIWTITVDGHVATVDAPRGPDCDWDFYLNGDEVAIDFIYQGNDACWGLAHGTYSRKGDVVRFSFDRERFYDVLIDNAMFANGLHRIG